MPLMTWSDDYSVNIKAIDEQHRQLVNMVNDLHHSMLAGRSIDTLHDILKRLIEYTSVHFSTEEKLMEKYNYPGYVYHKAEHDKLTKTVLEFENKFQQNSTG